MDSSGLERQQRLLAERLATLDPYPASRFAGQGIVICAGGAHIFTSAYVLVRVLRETLNCQLPIEVWHFGRAEISECMQGLLEELRVDVIDANPVLARHPADISDGWQLKPFAILHSRFAEVLYLDADQVPIMDPGPVFEWPAYKDKGAVFWPDVVRLSARNPIWRILQVEAHEAPSFDSGQLIIDKPRHWAALHATLHLNEQADYFYQLIYGDKDTFLAGWIAASHEYALVPHPPYVDAICLFQRDFNGDVLFQHRSGAKWTYTGPQAAIKGFEYFDACEKAIADLRHRWNGHVSTPPSRSLQAREHESRIQATCLHALRQPGFSDQALELLAWNQIGAGRTRNHQTWYVSESGTPFTIFLCDADADPVCALVLEDDGTWAGAWLSHPDRRVELRPLENPSPEAGKELRSNPAILSDPAFYVR